jgi:hypothetical protein
VRSALAAALWRSAPTRARALAAEARDHYARAGAGRRGRFAELETWLHEHQ